MEQARLQTRRLMQFFQCRPAVIFTILVGLGIGFTRILPIEPWVWLGGAAVLLLGAILVRWGLIRFGSLALATCLVGLSAGQIDRYQFSWDTIAKYATDGERFAQVELAIDQPPRLVRPSPGELRSLPPKQTLLAVVRGVKTTDGWQAADGKIAVTIEQPNLQLRAGEIVRMTGMLQRPAGPMNPGEFDYAAWCRDQRILATFRVEHADAVQIVRDGTAGPLVWLRDKSRHLLGLGFDDGESFDQALLQAFVFGDPDPQLRDLDDKFVRTGTIHYLAITGLHVAIIGAMALILCRLLRQSPRKSMLVALGVVLLYGMLAEPSWPGWRSIILCAAATVGLLGRRAMDSLHMFFVAVGAVLMIHPADLGNGGFQVSFAAVLGLILFSRAAEKRFWLWWQGGDPVARNISHRPGAVMLHWVWRFIVATFLASCVAWGMSMPLIAYHFGQLNSWAVPAGIVLLPLTVIALYAGVAKIFLTLFWPSGAHCWATAAAGPIVCMRHLIETLDRFPGATIAMAPPIWMLIVYYGLILLFFVPIRVTVWRWSARMASTAACAALLLLPNVGGGVPASAAVAGVPLRITLVSVGAGQCAVIRPTPDHAIFVDVGSDTISDVGRQLVLPWLRAEHCTNVDKILLSHGDFDHISAAAEVFRNYDEPTVYTSPHFARHAVGNFPATSLLHVLQAAGRPPTIIHQGDHVDLGNGAGIDVLWPPVNCSMDSNDCGLVLMLKFGGERVLFRADIQVAPERELLKHPELLRADVLVAPHHGSAEITTAEFIRAVHPRYILASNAEKLTHKQRMFDTLAGNYPLYRTSRCGAIDLTVETSGEIEIQTFLGVGPQEAAFAKER
jgi:competence protein ComEC